VFFHHDRIAKVDMGKGVVRQDFAQGGNLNVLHWNMADGSEVTLHSHTQEQFGYVIKGGFKMLVGEETRELRAGDGYIIPPNVPHSFVAVGDTEAIDVFSPVKHDFPWVNTKA
jgi:quercetin dioxygenase-like cupin family protein